MVKLSMVRKIKEYKFFVVGSIANKSMATSMAIFLTSLFDNLNNGKVFFAQVYDSYTKEWTIMEATHGCIIGWDTLGRFDLPFPCRICMHNFANRMCSISMKPILHQNSRWI